MLRLVPSLLAGLYIVASAPAAVVTSVPVGTAITGSFTYDTTATGTPVGGPWATPPAAAARKSESIQPRAQPARSMSPTTCSPPAYSPFTGALLTESVTANLLSHTMYVVTSQSATTPPGVLASLAPPDPFPSGFGVGSFALQISKINDGDPFFEQEYRYAFGNITFTTVPGPSTLALGAMGVELVFWRRCAANS